MAHNLYVGKSGQASMFYFGETPWHRLGRKLDQPATAAQAIEAAGLDYKVVKRPLFTKISRQNVLIPDHFATVRSDNGVVLGCVGSRYEPVQNRDAFGFFDPLVDRDEAIYHTGGVLGKGEKIWLLAKLPGYIRVGKSNDLIEKYLLLYNSHDGSSHIRIKLTPIRVVCNNTLSVALSGTEQEVKIKHTATAPAKLEEAHTLLGLTNHLFDQLSYIFNRMALRKVTDRELVQYVKTLIPDNPEAAGNTRTENLRKKILDIHATQRDAIIHRGTLFGAYNAVTELVDHVSTTEDPSKRLKSMWFGSGEKLKQRAFSLAEDYLKN
jgi:phage/plasmid-like protein (TIGR03299 family)